MALAEGVAGALVVGVGVREACRELVALELADDATGELARAAASTRTSSSR